MRLPVFTLLKIGHSIFYIKWTWDGPRWNWSELKRKKKKIFEDALICQFHQKKYGVRPYFCSFFIFLLLLLLKSCKLHKFAFCKSCILSPKVHWIHILHRRFLLTTNKFKSANIDFNNEKVQAVKYIISIIARGISPQSPPPIFPSPKSSPPPATPSSLLLLPPPGSGQSLYLEVFSSMVSTSLTLFRTR